MFNSKHLYRLFKPRYNEELITKYEVIIGGTILPADLVKGAIVITLLSSNSVTSQVKDFKKLRRYNEDYGLLNEYSIIQNDYQVDIYKVNDCNVNFIQVEREAIKIKEWLKSLEVINYLERLKSQILPCYSVIRYSSDLYNELFVNRAIFDISIITRVKIIEKTELLKDVKIESKFIQ